MTLLVALIGLIVLTGGTIVKWVPPMVHSWYLCGSSGSFPGADTPCSTLNGEGWTAVRGEAIVVQHLNPGPGTALTRRPGASGCPAVSYTHLTLPTNREV